MRTPHGPLLFVLSATDRAALGATVSALAAHVRTLTEPDPTAMAATLMLGRRPKHCRLALLHRPGDSLDARLAEAAAMLNGTPAHEVWVGDAEELSPDPNAAAEHIELFQDGRLAALAALWVRGEPIDWSALIPPLPRPVLLPEPAPPAAVARQPAPIEVAIVGLACRMPGAIDAEAFWDMLQTGRDGITAAPPEPWRAATYHRLLSEGGSDATTWGGYVAEVDRFDPLFFNLSPKDAEAMDPQQRLFLETAWHALEDAGQTREGLNGVSCGIFVGVGQGDYSQLLPRDASGVSGQTLLGNTASILTARLAYWLNLKGPCIAIDTACSSSLVATHLAWKSILDGECSMALAGGINLMLTPQMHAMTGAAGMLALGGRCRTFDNAADGFVPGEGVGVIVLKRLDLALADGDRIYAVIAGSGINQDGKTSSITAPSAVSQIALETAVHARFDIDVDAIGLVEAHGTGTKLGDPIEVAALTEAFAARTTRRGDCALGSVKTNVGHTLAASGVAGLIKLALAFRHLTLPPSLHFEHANEHIDFAASPFVVNTARRPWPAPASGRRLAAISAFGFSGTNAHMILAEPSAAPTAISVAAPALIVISGRTEAALGRQKQALAAWLDRGATPDLADLAHTLARRRTHFAHRAAIVAADLVFLRNQLIGETGPQEGALAAVGRHFVAGERIDWASVVPTARLIALPGYAFARDRYWVAQPEGIWLGPSDPMLAGHVVGGRRLLPAAATLGLIHTALRPGDGGFTVRNLLWLRPIEVVRPVGLQVTRGESCDVTISVDGKACITAAIAGPPAPAAAAPLGAIRARCGTAVAVERLDAGFARAGIVYGANYRTIHAIWTGANEVLARIDRLDGADPYPAAMLDGALRVAAALVLGQAGEGPPMLPASADAVFVHAPLPAVCWSHVVVQPADAGFRCDVTVMDDDGNVLLAIEGFQSRAEGPPQTSSALPSREGPGVGSRSQCCSTEGEVLHLRPTWRLIPAPAIHSSGPVLLVHGPEECTWAQGYAAAVAPQPIRLLADVSAADLAGVEEVLFCAWGSTGPAPDFTSPASGPQRLLRLLQAIGGARMALKVVTRGIQAAASGDSTVPAFASLLGLAGTAAHEMPGLTLSLVDLPQQETPEHHAAHIRLLAGEPGAPAELAYRGGRRLQRRLERFEPHVALPDGAPLVPHKAVCLIIGGAGGIGVVTSRWLIERFGARLVWVGRRAETAEIRTALAGLGGEARYRRADASDPVALGAVIAATEAEWGSIDLVVQAALALADRSLARMTPDLLSVALAAKAGTAAALDLALGSRRPALWVFSSSNSFTLNRGQANYAAGCTFIDAWGRAYGERTGAAVRIINWGFWGDVGAVATDEYRARAAREGVAAIRATEGIAALGRSGLGQAVIVKLLPDQLENAARHYGQAWTRAEPTQPPPADWGIPQQTETTDAQAAMDAVIAYGASVLDTRLRQAGLLPAGRHALPALHRPIVPGNRPMFHALLSILSRTGRLVLTDDGVVIPGSAAEQVARPAGNDGIAGMLSLLDMALDGVAAVVTGQRNGSEVLFPGGSSALVEGVYRDNPLVDRFNAQMATVAARLAAGRRLRVLEIGAGTGGASLGIVQALAASGGAATYDFTDVSAAFMAAAGERFAAHDFVRCRVLDITRDPRLQGLDAGSYDLVVASNVLHATPDVARAVRHAKTLLKRGGMLMLNEVTAASDFATLTFGLTRQWWAFEDAERRLPGGPALDLAGWEAVLWEEGFTAMQAPGVPKGTAPGQCVMVAFSDGWLPALPDPGPSSAPAPHLPSPASRPAQAVGDYLRTVFAEVLKLPSDAIDPATPYDQYGVDSLVTQELRVRMERDLGPLPGTLLLEHATIESLGRAISGVFQGWHGTPPLSPPNPTPTNVKPALRHEHPVAIVGVAGRYPGAEDVPALWRLLREGRSAITEVPRDRWDVLQTWDPDGLDPVRAVGKWGGFLDGADCFDPLFFGIAPAEAALMDPQERLFLQTVWHLLENAGTTRARLRASAAGPVGLFVGASSTDWLRLSTEAWAAGDAAAGGTAFWSIANRASFFFDLAGPSLVVDTACSSSLTALHLACESVASGACGAAIAGGVHLILHPRGQIGLSQMGLMSRTGACRAFDAAADGMVEGEGVGAVLLRPLADAERDGDRILGIIRGSAIGGSGRTAAYMLPNPNTQADVIRSALARAGVAPGSVRWVEAQAAGSVVADPVEVAALAAAYGAGGSIALGSLKPNIGHGEASSGMAQLTKVLLQFEHGALTPTIGVDRLNPGIAFNGLAVQTTAHAAPAGAWHAAVNSSGAGGAHAHVVLEAPALRPVAEHPTGPLLFPLSARTPEQLRSIAVRLRAAVTETDLPLTGIAYTLQVGREALPCRAVLSAADRPGLLQQLDAVIAGSTILPEPYADWVSGGSVDWDAAWPGARPMPVALPGYPFERRRCWLAPRHPPATLPATRLALMVEGPGRVEDLVFRALPVVPPSAGEVVIGVQAFALNFSDVLCVSGLYPNLPPYPFVPGMEAAGVVLAVGAGVTDLAAGDEVVALTGTGAHATIVTAAASCVVRRPPGMDPALAASIPVAVLTAQHCFDRAGLDAGETVLIQSAAGGVGLAAVQLAIARGARVIGVVGTADKAAHLRALGVAGVIERGREDVPARVRALVGERGVDVVLNTRGGADIQMGLDLLAPGGRYVEIALAGLQASGPLDLSRLIDNQSFITVNLGRILSQPDRARRALEVALRVAAPPVGRIFPLVAAADAYAWLASGQSIGKIIVAVDGSATASTPAGSATQAGVGPVAGRLRAIVAAAFDIDAADIDPARSLVEYGLTSVLGTAIMRAVQQAFGIALGVTLLWEHPTLDRLTQELERRLQVRTGSAMTGPVVPIQTAGTRPPSFWVHGAPGEISWVVALALALGPDFPVYGIEALGIDGVATPRESVPAMAEAYVAALLAAQPAGPYWLGGYSAGGPIAFEMACQLHAQGHKVGRVVLLDSPAPGTAALRGMDAVAEGFIFRLAARWLGDRWGLPPLDEAELAGHDGASVRTGVIAYLQDPALPGRDTEFIGRMLDALDRVGNATGRALQSYRPRQLPAETEVILFQCRDGMGGQFEGSEDYLLGWDALFTAPIRRVAVGCDHFRLMQQPWRDEVAAVLAGLGALGERQRRAVEPAPGE